LTYNIWVNFLIFQNCPSALNISEQTRNKEKENKKSKRALCTGLSAQCPEAQPTRPIIPFSLACQLPRGCARPRRRAGDSEAATDAGKIRPEPVHSPWTSRSLSPTPLGRSAPLLPSRSAPPSTPVAVRPSLSQPPATCGPLTVSSRCAAVDHIAWCLQRVRGGTAFADRRRPSPLGRRRSTATPSRTEPSPSRLLIGDHRCKLGSFPDIFASPLVLCS
jgi:hypothetical protein